MKGTQITLVKIINRSGNHKPTFSKSEKWSEDCIRGDELRLNSIFLVCFVLWRNLV